MVYQNHDSESSVSSFSSQDVESDEVVSPTQSSGFGDAATASRSSHNKAIYDSQRSNGSIHDDTNSLKSDGESTLTRAAVLSSASHQSPKAKAEPVTWSSLPKKGQLAILTLARLSEPLAERSLAAYMFYQLRSFDPTLPDSTITSQGGMLTAAFAGAQFITAVWWGRAADTSWIGRKRVLLVGLFGTALASVGVGFSTTFTQALCFRILAGALNGNIGVMRTMISEMIQEKKFQSRAFLLLPMCFNIGVVIGPIMGGFLADPIASFPTVFGAGSALGGKDGVGWMKAFPYGLPNLFSGFFIMLSALAVILGLDETHHALRNQPDYGRKVGKWLLRTICRRGRDTYSYTRLSNNEGDTDVDAAGTSTSLALDSQPQPSTKTETNHAIDIEQDPTRPTTQPSSPKPKRTLLNRNVLLTLTTHHLMALHVSSFNTLIFLFLPSPRSPTPPSHFTLAFTGGLGLSSSNVGLATAIMGLIGFPLQLLIYPPLQAKLGTLKGYRLFLPFSALAYTAIPFLAILPDKPYVLWPALALVLAAQMLSRTFTLTSSVILINNSSPGPDVLGTIHGVAQSVSSAGRMLGPTVSGWGLGLGLKGNCVGAVWWALTLVVAVNWSLLWCVFEGDGNGGRA